MMGIVRHKAQSNLGPTAHIPEELEFRAPISAKFPGGHTTGIAARNTLKDLQVVIAATVNMTYNTFL
jgi:hypothetical protein